MPRAKQLLLACGLVLAAGLPAADDANLSLETDRPVLAPATEQNVVLLATVTAPERLPEPRPPLRLAVVLDCSTAMDAAFLSAAGPALAAALARLAPADTLTLIACGEPVRTLVSGRRLADLGDPRPLLAGLRAKGRAALFGGLCQALAELQPAAGGNTAQRLILITPGLPGVGPDGAAEFERLAQVLRKAAVPVSVIGVGPEANADLLTRLAQTSEGRALFVTRAAELETALVTAVEEAARVCGRRLTLTVDGGAGVSPVRLLNGEGQRTANGFTVQFNYLNAGQPRYLLGEWRVAPGRDQGDREVARARIRYERAADGRPVELTQGLAVRVSADPQQLASVNPQVQKAVLRNDFAQTLDATADLLDEGRIAEAIRSLRYNAGNFRQQGQKGTEFELKRQATALENLAQRLESQAPAQSQNKGKGKLPAEQSRLPVKQPLLQQELRRDSYQQRADVEDAVEAAPQTDAAAAANNAAEATPQTNAPAAANSATATAPQTDAPAAK